MIVVVCGLHATSCHAASIKRDRSGSACSQFPKIEAALDRIECWLDEDCIGYWVCDGVFEQVVCLDPHDLACRTMVEQVSLAAGDPNSHPPGHD